MKIEGSGSASGSGSISQRHGSADPDPDPHQNVIDPQHWFYGSGLDRVGILDASNERFFSSVIFSCCSVASTEPSETWNQ